MPNTGKIVDFRIFAEVRSEQVFYPAGSVIISPEIDYKSMYVIEKGKASIIVNGKFIAEIESGNIFGEMGLVDPQPHSATIVALTDITLYRLSEQQFVRLVGIYPIFALRVMRVIAQRVRAMNDLLTVKNQLSDHIAASDLIEPAGFAAKAHTHHVGS
jgi:CRP/FNR family transcriptional regulator, cyclic AMP receptor protein